MIDLDINRQVNCNLTDGQLLGIANVFAQLAKLKGNSHVSLALVTDREIRKWNKLYRGVDKVTDVLSFVEQDSFLDPSVKDNYLGEIIISLPRAKKQAQQYGCSVKQEITRLLVHGLSHLAGYEHENVSAYRQKKMEKLEDLVMARLGFF